MFYRTKKRLVIISIYFFIIGLLIFLISRKYVVGPNCFDRKQNQDEQDIDCGGVCEKVLQNSSTGGKCVQKLKAKDIVMNEEDIFVLYGGEDLYDLAVKISNPNELYGAESFEYVITLKNESGEIVATREGKSFLLPVETKYLVETNLETKEKVASANVFIKQGVVKWVKFIEYKTPKITIQNQRFGLLENNPNFAMAFGLVVNESPIDFNRINVNVIIKDKRGIPIAVNRTEMRTVYAGDKREFKLLFPKEFPGGRNMTNTEMQAEVNVFDNKNFMKIYSEGARLHELGN